MAGTSVTCSAGRILGAPGRPVDLDHYALRVGSRFDQVKRQVRAGAGEQPRSLAEDHRDDEQGDLVDEVVAEQPADQGAAAVHLQLTSRLGLQPADGRREVTGQDGRVRPARFGERGRCDVLGRLIQRHADGVGAHLLDCSPGAGEELVGPPAEQERVGALVGLGDQRPGLVVACPPGPSAAVESVPAVLIRRVAVSLHHSIDGDLRHDRQFHDRGSLLPAAPLAGGLLPLLRTPPPRSDIAPRTSSGGLSGTPATSDPAARRSLGDSADWYDRPAGAWTGTPPIASRPTLLALPVPNLIEGGGRSLSRQRRLVATGASPRRALVIVQAVEAGHVSRALPGRSLVAANLAIGLMASPDAVARPGAQPERELDGLQGLVHGAEQVGADRADV